MVPILHGPLSQVVGIGSCNIITTVLLYAIIWDLYKAIDYGECVDLLRWSVREVLLYVKVTCVIMLFIKPIIFAQ